MMIGVHTPEFSFEHDVDNVRETLASMRVGYPIALDNDYAVWNAFANRYWPALYFIDAEGRIRHHRFGEGDEERSESVIQELLAEAGADGRRDRSRLGRSRRTRRRGRLGRPGVAGDLPRVRADPGLRFSGRLHRPSGATATPVPIVSG